MSGVSKPASKTKMLLVWALVFGNIFFWVGFFLWRAAKSPPPDAEHQADLGHSIFYFIIGCFFLFAGVAGYFGVLLTNCMTFDFSRPVWAGVKGRKYAVNIVVPVAVMLGFGFMLAAFVTPILARLNVSGDMAFAIPVFGTLLVLQCVTVWVGIWTPLEMSLIKRRLMSLGIRPEQFQGGWYVGLSNPAITSSMKRFGGIEEDIGMLWFSPAQIIYWGDSEQFGITREQLIDVERKADSKSVTMLSGTLHAILHVRLPDGNVRLIRLHNEGIWTMGGKKKAADELTNRIEAWRTEAVTA